MYAVISTGTKQFKVQQNEIVAVDRMTGNVGDKVTFDKVLAMGEGASLTVGTPVIAGAKVEAEIVSHFRDDKIVVFKMKRRKGYRRKQGHRQEMTKIKISSISK